jgi:hypothetical protein
MLSSADRLYIDICSVHSRWIKTLTTSAGTAPSAYRPIDCFGYWPIGRYAFCSAVLYILSMVGSNWLARPRFINFRTALELSRSPRPSCVRTPGPHRQYGFSVNNTLGKPQTPEDSIFAAKCRRRRLRPRSLCHAIAAASPELPGHRRPPPTLRHFLGQARPPHNPPSPATAASMELAAGAAKR